MKESLSPDHLQHLDHHHDSRPEVGARLTSEPGKIAESQPEENGAQRWSIYFKSKKLRSYSVKENSTNMVNDQRERRLSDFIGLQNVNVSRKVDTSRQLASLRIESTFFPVRQSDILSANCTKFKCLKLLPFHINLNSRGSHVCTSQKAVGV